MTRAPLSVMTSNAAVLMVVPVPCVLSGTYLMYRAGTGPPGNMKV